MPLSVRRRRYLRRLVGLAANPLHVRARVSLNRDQSHEIGGHPVRLPPEHNLPFYQRRDPTYDTYAAELVRALGREPVTVIDIGGNVGDTAVAMAAIGPHVHVVTVEGSPRFLQYLRGNVATFGERVVVIERFVGPLGGRTSYTEENGTGSFNRDGGLDVQDWVTPRELLDRVRTGSSVVFKSDIDGLDVHLLASHWDDIDEASDVIWFEYDPSFVLGDREDLDRLTDQLAASQRWIGVFDNLGRRMATAAPGEPTRQLTSGIRGWLESQRDGHVAVPYVDIWAVRPHLRHILDARSGHATVPIPRNEDPIDS